MVATTQKNNVAVKIENLNDSEWSAPGCAAPGACFDCSGILVHRPFPSTLHKRFTLGISTPQQAFFLNAILGRNGPPRDHHLWPAASESGDCRLGNLWIWGRICGRCRPECHRWIGGQGALSRADPRQP